MGEEWGWRAFALPHLQKKHNAFLSSIIIGIIWTLWHWPHFLLKDSTMNSLYGSFLIFSFSILLDSILYTWLYNSGKGNMLTAIVLHASINAMIAVNLPNTINFQLIVKLVIVLIVILVFKWNILSRDSKITIDQIIEHYSLKEEVPDQKKNF
jgi:membrane protease YdiL (CAAX protease family)